MRNITSLSDFWTVTQAADELGIPARTLHYRITSGKIAATKVGDGKTSAYLILRADIEALIEATTPPVTGPKRRAS